MKRRLFGAGAPGLPREPDGRPLRLSDKLVFGRVYTQPGLALKTRSMLTVAALTVLGRPEGPPHRAGGDHGVGGGARCGMPQCFMAPVDDRAPCKETTRHFTERRIRPGDSQGRGGRMARNDQLTRQGDLTRRLENARGTTLRELADGLPDEGAPG